MFCQVFCQSLCKISRRRFCPNLCLSCVWAFGGVSVRVSAKASISLRASLCQRLYYLFWHGSCPDFCQSCCLLVFKFSVVSEFLSEFLSRLLSKCLSLFLCVFLFKVSVMVSVKRAIRCRNGNNSLEKLGQPFPQIGTRRKSRRPSQW